ncbi:hypothetical protein [Flavobacterium sp.]|uniref:hypothetical protein n=1 Tax=Flavobacterium sp. TaxID=239 RepID=UPI00260C622A|nr:hypothetical protein [Flavobacterium sp.]
MEKQTINNDVTEEDLKSIFQEINNLSKDLNDLAVDIFKIETAKKLVFTPSIFIFSAINRAIALNKAYITLCETENYITAVGLLRLQADNCMRVYAVSLVNDRGKFFQDVLAGKHIRNMIDAEGNKMTDDYLATELNKHFPGFKSLYKNASGYIHFSNEHLKLNKKTSKGNGFFINELLINGGHNFKIPHKVDFSYNMLLVGTELYKLIKGYRLHIIDLLDNY